MKLGSVIAGKFRIERVVGRRKRDQHPAFAGIATRALALATDAIVTTAAFMAVVGVVAIIASLVGGLQPEWLVAALLSVGWALLAGAYFVLFWSTAGRTPGMRLLRLHMEQEGRIPSVGRSIVRLIGLWLSIAVFFIGFVPVLFDRRRRGLADFLAGTVVLYDDVGSATSPADVAATQVPTRD